MFLGGGAQSPCNTMWPRPRPAFAPSGILIHPAVWPQWTWAENWGGGLRLLVGNGKLGPNLAQCGWEEAYLHTKWHLDASSRLATIEMGRKFEGGLCPFAGGGAGSPSNTTWPGPRPTCVPSFILICQTVSPQYTNVTDRTDR